MADGALEQLHKGKHLREEGRGPFTGVDPDWPDENSKGAQVAPISDPGRRNRTLSDASRDLDMGRLQPFALILDAEVGHGDQ